MKFKKAMALGLAGAMTMSMLAGCGSTGGTDATKGGSTGSDQVKLIVSLWDYTNTAYYKTMIDAFEKKYPNVKVEVKEISAAEYSDTIVVKMGAKENYDVVFMKGLPEMAALIANGHLVALDDYAKNIDMAPYGGAEKSLTVDGKLYGMPFRKDNNLIFYNKDLFDAAGVAYPTDGMSMDEYRELAKKMTSGEGANKVYGTHVHTWTSNVYQYPNYAGKFVYNDTSTYDNLIPYYETILAMQNEDKTVQDFGTLKTGNIHYSGVFYKEQVAMLQIGTWYINMLMENVKTKEEGGFNWGVCSMPNNEGIGNTRMVGGITPVAIGKYGEHQKEAWDFINFVTGEEGAKVLAATGIVPGWTGKAVLDIFDKIPETHKNAPEGLSKYLDLADYIVEQPMDPKGKAIVNVLDEMHSAIMTNADDIKTAIENAKKKAKEAGAK